VREWIAVLQKRQIVQRDGEALRAFGSAFPVDLGRDVLGVSETGIFIREQVASVGLFRAAVRVVVEGG
jgi:hypothetical protein